MSDVVNGIAKAMYDDWHPMKELLQKSWEERTEVVRDYYRRQADVALRYLLDEAEVTTAMTLAGVSAFNRSYGEQWFVLSEVYRAMEKERYREAKGGSDE